MDQERREQEDKEVITTFQVGGDAHSIDKHPFIHFLHFEIGGQDVVAYMGTKDAFGLHQFLLETVDVQIEVDQELQGTSTLAGLRNAVVKAGGTLRSDDLVYKGYSYSFGEPDEQIIKEFQEELKKRYNRPT